MLQLMIKKVNGRPSVFWKEFMRDKIWLPEDGIGWPVFKPDVDFNLSSLSAMPTRPVNGLAEEQHALWDGHSETTFLMAPDQMILPHCMYREPVQRPAGLTHAELRILQRVNASEEVRQTSNAVWLGHKSRRPPKTKENRQGWSSHLTSHLSQISQGSFSGIEGPESFPPPDGGPSLPSSIGHPLLPTVTVKERLHIHNSQGRHPWPRQRTSYGRAGEGISVGVQAALPAIPSDHKVILLHL
ncbi:hypothetical protein WJX77_001366 [Trebouxia sp. C0004]